MPAPASGHRRRTRPGRYNRFQVSSSRRQRSRRTDSERHCSCLRVRVTGPESSLCQTRMTPTPGRSGPAGGRRPRSIWASWWPEAWSRNVAWTSAGPRPAAQILPGGTLATTHEIAGRGPARASWSESLPSHRNAASVLTRKQTREILGSLFTATDSLDARILSVPGRSLPPGRYAVNYDTEISFECSKSAF